MLLSSPMTSLSFFARFFLEFLCYYSSDRKAPRSGRGIRPPLAAACLGGKSTGERGGGFLLSSLKKLMDKATEATGDRSDGNT